MPGTRPRRIVLGIALGIVMILVGGYAGYRIFRSAPSSPLDLTLGNSMGKKSVAVMYLNNQSNTGELDWLREGLADMLINDLSRSKKLAVLNREQLHLALERIGYKPGDEITLQEALEIGRHSLMNSLYFSSRRSAGARKTRSTTSAPPCSSAPSSGLKRRC
jgi:hypothetical protein